MWGKIADQIGTVARNSLPPILRIATKILRLGRIDLIADNSGEHSEVLCAWDPVHSPLSRQKASVQSELFAAQLALSAMQRDVSRAATRPLPLL